MGAMIISQSRSNNNAVFQKFKKRLLALALPLELLKTDTLKG